MGFFVRSKSDHTRFGFGFLCAIVSLFVGNAKHARNGWDGPSGAPESVAGGRIGGIGSRSACSRGSRFPACPVFGVQCVRVCLFFSTNRF